MAYCQVHNNIHPDDEKCAYCGMKTAAELRVIDDGWDDDPRFTIGDDVAEPDPPTPEEQLRQTLAAKPGQNTLEAAQALVMAQEAWCHEAHRLAAIVDKVLVAVPQDYGCDFEGDDETYRQQDRRVRMEIYQALYHDPTTGEYLPPCPACNGTGRERKAP